MPRQASRSGRSLPRRRSRSSTAPCRPLVDGDRVIIQAGGPGDTALTAFDVATGEARWRWTGDSPAYGSPIAVELAGTRQIVTFTHKNLVGVSAARGPFSEPPVLDPADTTSQTPVLHRDMLIQVAARTVSWRFEWFAKGDGFATEDVWRTDRSLAAHDQRVAIDGVRVRAFAPQRRAYFAPISTRKVLWTSDPRQAENVGFVRRANDLALEDDGETWWS